MQSLEPHSDRPPDNRSHRTSSSCGGGPSSDVCVRHSHRTCPILAFFARACPELVEGLVRSWQLLRRGRLFQAAFGKGTTSRACGKTHKRAPRRGRAALSGPRKAPEMDRASAPVVALPPRKSFSAATSSHAVKLTPERGGLRALAGIRHRSGDGGVEA